MNSIGCKIGASIAKNNFFKLLAKQSFLLSSFSKLI